MNARATAALIVCSLVLAAAQPSAAMPMRSMTKKPDVQPISVHEPSPRSLLISRTETTLAVEPEWNEGWGVPIIGSARILPSRLVRW